MSSVIRLTRKEGFELDCDYAAFKTVVKMAFGQRRKMLRNTLKGLVKDPAMLKEEVFTKRPEELGVDEFVALTLKIQSAQEGIPDVETS